MKYFNNSPESNNIELSSINTFDIDLQHPQTTRREMVSYNNKTKDQSYPHVYTIPIKSDKPYTLKSDQLLSINNIVTIPRNPPNSTILSSQEK
jgi:hypothetical protein